MDARCARPASCSSQHRPHTLQHMHMHVTAPRKTTPTPVVPSSRRQAINTPSRASLQGWPRTPPPSTLPFRIPRSPTTFARRTRPSNSPPTAASNSPPTAAKHHGRQRRIGRAAPRRSRCCRCCGCCCRHSWRWRPRLERSRWAGFEARLPVDADAPRPPTCTAPEADHTPRSPWAPAAAELC